MAGEMKENENENENENATKICHCTFSNVFIFFKTLLYLKNLTDEREISIKKI